MSIEINSKNEIGNLANSFETMRNAIYTTQSELKFLNDNLEKTVEERLVEIKTTNQRLSEREHQLSMMNQSLITHKQDLTDSNTKLQTQKKQLQNIVAAISFPLYVISNDHKIILMNKAAETFLGDTNPQERICCFTLKYLPEAGKCTIKESRCPLCVVTSTKKPFRGENIYFDENGQRRTIDVHAFPIFDESGDVTQIVEYCVDVTERKEAEYELKRARRNLQQLLDSMPIGIVLISENERIVQVNQTALSMSGYEHANEVINMSCQQLFVCDRHATDCTPNTVNNSEEKLITKNKIEVSILKSVVPIRFDNQNLYLGSFVDITEYKAAEVDKIRLENELIQARKLESIGTLAAGVAHEINTPIQFIGDNTKFVADAVTELCSVLNEYQTLFSNDLSGTAIEDLVHKNEDLIQSIDLDFLQEEIPQALRQTQEGVNQVSRIVRAMRDFSHVGVESKQKENLNSAIETTMTISRNVWKYVAEIEKDFDPELPLVNCCIGDIKQVVLNLLVNASHSIKDALDTRGEDKGTITIKTFVSKGSAIIAITDTGMGIPDEIKEKVFDHFFTTKEVGQGTGQGLSMAYQTIVDKHQGKLWFDSTINKGTTFYILLPID